MRRRLKLWLASRPGCFNLVAISTALRTTGKIGRNCQNHIYPYIDRPACTLAVVPGMRTRSPRPVLRARRVD
ncbi:hypothetical protein F4802DRAFT_577836 [Xylaria palmicola]|nr:hypothetical protein F4802DRAFT_577836 [Xylaria palmicola]